jgi:hypothetical protein
MSDYEILRLLFLFLAGHALGDFALQNEWMATNKNRQVRKLLSPEMQAKTQVIWPYLLTSHALIHGLIVYLITQKLSLGVLETITHWITDFLKCEKKFGFHLDQFIHIGFKIIWILLMYFQIV